MRVLKQAVDVEQQRAHAAIANAIYGKRLIRPSICSLCQKEGFIVAHHPNGYKDHYFDIVWLCEQCHKRVHRLVGPTTPVMVYVPRPLYERLRRAVYKLNTTLSSFICEAIEKALGEQANG